jgi:hypothetical protein
VTRYGSKHYWTVAGSFLFVSALIIYHGSRQVLLEFQSEHQQHQLVSVYADPLVECLCDDAKLINPSSNVLQIHRSSCSQEADRRGYNQSVVSYSLFGHPDENDEVLRRYFSSIEAKAARIRRYYTPAG